MLDREDLAADTGQVFHELDDENLPDAVRQLVARAGDDLVEDLMRIGVHVNGRVIAASAEVDDNNEPLQVGLQMDGFISDLAFSDQVLHPQACSDEDILADIEQTTVAHDYETIRKGLLGEA